MVLFLQLLIIGGACILQPTPGHSSLIHFYWIVGCAEAQSRGDIATCIFGR